MGLPAVVAPAPRPRASSRGRARSRSRRSSAGSAAARRCSSSRRGASRGRCAGTSTGCINAESANLHRSVAAAGRQLAAIDALEADGRLAEQPRTVRAVAEARRETPEASLSEIAARLDLHRSAVQRALDRLERLALHDDEGIGRRGGRGRAGRGGGPKGRREAPAPLA